MKQKENVKEEVKEEAGEKQQKNNFAQGSIVVNILKFTSPYIFSTTNFTPSIYSTTL